MKVKCNMVSDKCKLYPLGECPHSVPHDISKWNCDKSEICGILGISTQCVEVPSG